MASAEIGGDTVSSSASATAKGNVTSRKRITSWKRRIVTILIALLQQSGTVAGCFAAKQ
jgi:hypothetical protein